MIWWARIRRTRALVAVVLGVVALTVVAGTVDLPLPSLLGSAAPVPLGMFPPLAVAILLVAGLLNGDEQAESTSARPIAVLDAGLALAACAAVTLLSVPWFLVEADRVLLACARNTCGYVGLALLVRATGRNEAAALFPVVAALLASLFGRSTGSIAWWAWPVAAGDDPLAAGLALATLVLGLAAALRPR